MRPSFLNDIIARLSTPQAPPPNPVLVRIDRLACQDFGETELAEVRKWRRWCEEKCSGAVFIQWLWEAGLHVPVAYCANEVDAVFFKLRWA